MQFANELSQVQLALRRKSYIVRHNKYWAIWGSLKRGVSSLTAAQYVTK